MKIRKAVIPIAGKGTRFLPVTKQMPKEMIPILKTPMIHYVVDEAIKSGIEEIVFVTSYGKNSIEDYFDRNFEYELFLEKNKKFEELELIRNIGSKVEFVTVRQKEQLGLGHAVLMAEKVIKEDFAVILGDDLIFNDPPATKQLIECYEKNNGSVIGVMEVPKQDVSKYGIIDGKSVDKNTILMNQMVEKPSPEKAPSNLATPGRYILKESIFECLKKIPRGSGGEYQLTDAINLQCSMEKVFGYKYIGERFDTGNINGYFEATVEMALRDKNMKEFALKILKEKVKKYE